VIRALTTLLLLAAPVAPVAAAPVADAMVLTGGTRVVDTKVGSGAVAISGKAVTLHYTGWLYVDGGKGKKFDSSLDRGEPFRFLLGGGQVIGGWDEGVVGMQVGGKRTLIIPPEQGYGDNGAGADIPPGATLIFDVELLKVE